MKPTLLWSLVFFTAPFAGLLAPKAQAADMPASIHELRLKTLEGEEQSLSRYKGKVLLMVNTASRCGYTPQYQGLQTVYERYRSKGFEVLGFPSNDFGGQEPGSAGEIRKFCSTKYKVGFPLFEKKPVSGRDKQVLYRWLIANEPGAGGSPTEVAWNFEKFLVGKDGKVLARFKSGVHPESPEVLKAIEGALK
jgi:glutathione peroxidase